MRKIICCLLLFYAPALRGAEFDAAIEKLSTDLATGIAKSNVQKLSVVDFLDLQGHGSELGRFVAEQLSVALVNSKGKFTIMDRANMKSILDEHKLTAQGLVNPERARELGRFSGVDAIILGSITQFGESITFTAKAISTETTQVLAASKVSVKKNKDMVALLVPEAPALALPQVISPAIPTASQLGSAKFNTIAVEVLSFQQSSEGVMVLLKVTNLKAVALKLGLNVSSEYREGTAFVVDEQSGETFNLVKVSGLSYSTSRYGNDRNSLETIRNMAGAADQYGARNRGFVDNLFRELDRYSDIETGQSLTFTLVFRPERRAAQGSQFRFHCDLLVVEMLPNRRISVRTNNVVISGIRP